MGYHRAGYDVWGVDIVPFKRYPFTFVQMDAIKFLDNLIAQRDGGGLPIPFTAIHASPPCQAWTAAQRIRQNDHPDLIGPTRERLRKIGLPYIIENVVGAPLEDPFLLCGSMFPGLRVYRHRLFETNFPVTVPGHPQHIWPITKMGRPPREGEFMHVVGNFSGVAAAREAMDIDWMGRNELREAIPPAYTEWVARQIPVCWPVSPGGFAGTPVAAQADSV